MNGTIVKLSSGFLRMLGYLYKSLCLTLLVLSSVKFMLDDGSWINYLILSAVGGCFWLAGHYGFARLPVWKTAK
jgi:hypothetical protein